MHYGAFTQWIVEYIICLLFLDLHIILIIIMLADPLPPPLDVQLTSVKPDKLTFNWSSVQQNCSTLQYGIESNCGTCTNDPPTLTSATCSFELSAISGGLCNFSVQSTVCGNITGSLSTPIRVTLKGKPRGQD